jgi:hypothetical protein
VIDRRETPGNKPPLQHGRYPVRAAERRRRLRYRGHKVEGNGVRLSEAARGRARGRDSACPGKPAKFCPFRPSYPKHPCHGVLTPSSHQAGDDAVDFGRSNVVEASGQFRDTVQLGLRAVHSAVDVAWMGGLEGRIRGRATRGVPSISIRPRRLSSLRARPQALSSPSSSSSSSPPFMDRRIRSGAAIVDREESNDLKQREEGMRVRWRQG